MTDSHLLTVGDLTFSDGGDSRPGKPDARWWFATTGENFDTGAAEPIERTIRTLLQDGARVVSEGRGNRTATIRVSVRGNDSRDLAEGEAVLWALDGKSTLMTYRPADGLSPTSVFEVFTVSIAPITDDFAETKFRDRAYTLRLVCHPTVRSVNEVLTPAIVSTTGDDPIITTIDDASSLTGWSTQFGSLADAGGYLTVTGSGSPRPKFTAPSPIDLSSSRYVSLVMCRDHRYASPSLSINQPLESPPELYVDGVDSPLVAMTAEPFNRYRYHFLVPAGTTAATVFLFAPDLSSPSVDNLQFLSLQRSDSPPISGTDRQKSMTVNVKGSARTQGNLEISHETDGLGSVLAYTWPQIDQAYSPPLRQYRTSGGTEVGDEDLVSGALDVLDTELVFDIPARALAFGSHQWMVRVASDTTGAHDVDWTAQVLIGGTPVGPLRSGTRSIPFGSTNTWRNVVLTAEMLPNLLLPGNSTAVVRLTLVAAAPGDADVSLDEGWLWNTSLGRLTWIECEVGTAAADGASNRAWLDAATFQRDRPVAFRGFSEDRSDAYYAGAELLSPGRHEFEAGLMNVFTVTSGAQGAQTALRHYPRWGSHAGL